MMKILNKRNVYNRFLRRLNIVKNHNFKVIKDYSSVNMVGKIGRFDIFDINNQAKSSKYYKRQNIFSIFPGSIL